MRDNFIKGYAVIKSKWLCDNILESYLPYFCSIILNEHWEVIDVYQLQILLENKYEIKFTIPFIKSVLSEAVKQEIIKKTRHKYVPCRDRLREFNIDETIFEKKWKKLIKEFTLFIKKENDNDIIFTNKELEERIIDFIDKQDDHVILNCIDNQNSVDNQFDYFWYRFILQAQADDSDYFKFIVSLCAGSLAKNALFYSSGCVAKLDRLSVYIDTPMIFALLGICNNQRKESYELLIKDMLATGCTIHIFNHNLEELLGILNAAANMAKSPKYDSNKANDASKFFHDSEMSDQEITEFITNVEDKLNTLNITVEKTTYDMTENSFQEDEEVIFNMIQGRYEDSNEDFRSETSELTINIDVKSIIMIYRKRQGNIATQIEKSRHLMLTTNNTLAHVCKEYDIKLNNEKQGHIPACITADLFGTLLWLNSPRNLINYQNKRLLADCYSVLQPNPRMINDFIEQLNKLRDDGTVTEEKFLLLRAHPIVRKKLLDITHGDYALFNENTIDEIYNKIIKDAEEEAHKQVEEIEKEKSRLEKVAQQTLRENHGLMEKNRLLEDRITTLEKHISEKDERAFNALCKRYSIGITVLIWLVITVICVLLDLEKIKIGDVNATNIIKYVFLTLALIYIPFAFIGYKQVNKVVRNYFNKKRTSTNKNVDKESKKDVA